MGDERMTDTPRLPFSGRSSVARSCSIRAAREAAVYRAEKTSKVLDVVRQSRGLGLTRHDCAALTGYPISSLCSILDALMHAGLVVEDGARRSGAWRKTCVVYKAREHRTTEAA
jgi:hypothetical protein